MVDNTFPQHGDEPDAANFAQMIGAAVATDFIIEGFTFDVDLGVPEVDVLPGVGGLQRGQMTTASPDYPSQETRSAAAIIAETERVNAIGLTDNAVNHIFLDSDVGSTDSPDVTASTTNSLPSTQSMKIGEVDTNQGNVADAKSEQWRLFRHGSLTFPTKSAGDSEDSQGRLPEGTVVYDRANDNLFVVTA